MKLAVSCKNVPTVECSYSLSECEQEKEERYIYLRQGESKRERTIVGVYGLLDSQYRFFRNYILRCNAGYRSGIEASAACVPNDAFLYEQRSSNVSCVM